MLINLIFVTVRTKRERLNYFQYHLVWSELRSFDEKKKTNKPRLAQFAHFPTPRFLRKQVPLFSAAVSRLPHSVCFIFLTSHTHEAAAKEPKTVLIFKDLESLADTQVYATLNQQD